MSLNDFGAGVSRPLQSQMLGCGGPERNPQNLSDRVSSRQSTRDSVAVQGANSPAARLHRLRRINRSAHETAMQEAVRCTQQAATAYLDDDRAELLAHAASFERIARALAFEVAQ